MAGAVSLLAACSSDVERLSDYPPVNTTASLPKSETVARTAPVSRVATRQLDNTAPATPSWSRPSYTPPARTAYRAPSAPARTSYRAPASSMTATNGYVTVRPGQTLYSISRANGLSVAQVAAANGLSAPYSLRAGQRLRIPGVSRPASPAPTFAPRTARATAPAPAQTPVATPVRGRATERNYSAAGLHRVAPGETLFSLGRKYHVNPYKIASYNGLPRNVQLKVGQRVKIPTASGWSMGQGAQTPHATTPSAPRPVKEARKTTPKDDSRIIRHDNPAPRQPEKRAETQPSIGASGFRWPVRGRVISTYGAKPGGARNEGINIAVPEGADVHAANDGVVAYAGNELKGYGNLVLIRHKNGWVTAYAHNKELFVRRGDRIRRGQVIAKAGSTGSVKTPQLHFELRKGASAVNPLKYLGTATAMN